MKFASFTFGVLVISQLSSVAFAGTNYVCRAYDGKYFFNTVGVDKQKVVNLAIKYCEQYGIDDSACKNGDSVVCKAVSEPKPAPLHLISIVDAKTKQNYVIHHSAPPRRPVRPHRGSGSGSSSGGGSAVCWAVRATELARCTSNLESTGVETQLADQMCENTYPASECN